MSVLQLPRRAADYSRVFPTRPPLHATPAWLEGVWMIGNTYRRKVGYHGEYPPSFLDRVLVLFGDLVPRLHAFSGSVHDPGGRSVDLRPELRPDVVATVLRLPFRTNSFGLAIADPPYTNADAERYGCPPVNKRLALKELARVVRPGGAIIWLDIRVPVYARARTRLVGMILLYTGSNRVIRTASILEVVCGAPHGMEAS